MTVSGSEFRDDQNLDSDAPALILSLLSLETDVIYGGIPTVFTLRMSFCDLFLENAEIGCNFSLAFCLLLLVALGIEDK